MALDSRISMMGQAPNVGQAINIFENALMNSQTRDIRQQQAGQQALINPLQVQQAQQSVDAGAAQAIDVANQRKLKSINDFKIANQSLINDAVNTGDATQLQSAMVKRREQLVQQGLPTDETDEALVMLGQGNIQGVISGLNDSVKLFNQQQGNVQQTRVTSSKILDDGTTVQSLSTGGTNVISPSGQVLEGSERTDALNSALQAKVQQKESIAKAVSGVKIDEVVTLETESAQIAQDIAAKKVTIDETKFKNKERRDQVINAKNARRKEADSAITQIDGLLEDDRFSKAFGKVVTTTPELLRPQESIDAIADVNQIKGLITLESRQKLKGQGTITDSEQKILAQSATVLDNPLISDERARKELRKIKRVFEDSSDRNQLKRETKDRIEAEAATPDVAQPSQFQEGQTATGPNGERIVYTNGQWTGL
jgi:hypothetical protein